MIFKKVRINEQAKGTITKKYLFIYLYMIIILLILTAVSSYAWLSMTKTPRVSNLSLYVNAFPGMEISLDPYAEEWTQQIKYSDMFSEEYKLRPATWSESDQRFYGARYSFDGRSVNSWEPLTDERHANNTSLDNHYCIGTFYARAGSNVIVTLTDAVEIDEGVSGSGTFLIGKPVWNEETLLHDNGGKGAETAIRIGIRVIRLNEDFTPTDEQPLFIIYEPNGDAHADGSFGYLDTPSIDGSATLVPSDRIIRQSSSSFIESDPVHKFSVIHQLGEFEGSTEIFELEQNETVMIQLYVWLEGQDVDCTNAISDAMILANLQFNATVKGSSGLVPIEPED